MSTERWSRVKEIFQEALERPEAERSSFVADACAQDAALRAEVGQLLAAHVEAEAQSEAPTSQAPVRAESLAPGASVELTEGVGSTIGRYRLLQEIGEGGFGVVFVAEQEAPVRRKVALKIIKLGMDTKQVVARFEAERQALALMDHPNIAKVLDGGATATGRPYFVMEFVRGVPITTYCDQNHLGLADRLRLFMDVCHAVQHAHQKGIIHRDIKPANVLVTVLDGMPAPKVIDFGIAKATHARLTEKTVFTEFRQLIGTPEYMSPEQAEMSELDIDTRSDVYSLGVLLYELLTGTTPFDPKMLRSVAYNEIQRIIREEDPPKPSTRLSTMGEAAGEIADHRRTDTPGLTRIVRGDLDWVVMKALEKDRTRRYETANSFAGDVKRFLGHEPVLAGPPRASYRIRKFARRNRVPLSAGAVVVAALMVGFSGTLYGFVKASRERDAKEVARAEAVMARDESDAVVTFLTEMLTAVDPREQGRDVSVREVLDEASDTLHSEFADRPMIRGRLRKAIGETYRSLGLYQDAEMHLRLALETRREILGPEHADTLASANNLGMLYRNQGRYADAERLYLATLAARKRIFGDDHPDTLQSTNNLANLFLAQGRYDDAEPLYQAAVEGRRRVLGSDDPATWLTMNNLAVLFRRTGHYGKAESMYGEVLDIQKRKLGPEHPDTLTSMSNLGDVLYLQGRTAEAQRLNEETMSRRRRVLGEDHPDTLMSMNNLAKLHASAGRFADAEELHRTVLAKRSLVLGEEHPDTLWSMHYLAVLHEKQGRYAEAEQLHVSVLERRRRRLGDEHAHTLASMRNLANLYMAVGRYDEAEPLYVRTLEIRTRVLGREARDTLLTMDNMADLYLAQGRSEAARSLVRERLAIWKKKAVARDAHANTKNSCAWMLLTCEFPELREPDMALSLAIEANELTGNEDPNYLDTLSLAYHMTGATQQAIVTQRKAIELVASDNPVLRASLQESLVVYEGELGQDGP